MNPFYDVNQEVTSPIFRSRVAAAAKNISEALILSDTLLSVARCAKT